MGIMHKNSTSVAVSNPAASAETVIYTTPSISIGPTGTALTPIDISGSIDVTTGTGASAIQIRCRQGSLTGIQVGPVLQNNQGAAIRQITSFGFTDTTTFLEAAGGGVYVITVQQVSGTGAGTTNAIDIKVMTLWHPQVSSAWPRWSRPVPLPLAGT